MDEVVEALEKYHGLVPLVYDIETMSLDEARPEDMQTAVYLKREADRVIAHHKYKRCLAMADGLTWEFNYIVDYVSSDFPNIRFKRNHRLKWINKWLELAEKFKDKDEAK